jgi:hypothetical protein
MLSWVTDTEQTMVLLVTIVIMMMMTLTMKWMTPTVSTQFGSVTGTILV